MNQMLRKILGLLPFFKFDFYQESMQIMETINTKIGGVISGFTSSQIVPFGLTRKEISFLRLLADKTNFTFEVIPPEQLDYSKRFEEKIYIQIKPQLIKSEEGLADEQLAFIEYFNVGLSLALNGFAELDSTFKLGRSYKPKQSDIKDLIELFAHRSVNLSIVDNTKLVIKS